MTLMEKPEIIKKFLEKGYQLDIESLNFLYQNQEKIGNFLICIGNIEKKPAIINIELIRTLLGRKSYDVEIIKQPTKLKKVVDASDFANFLSSRYETMKHLLVNRLDLINPISISKITQKTKKFSLIAMVKEKNEDEDSLIVDDMTGELTVFFDRGIENIYESIFLDEVLGVVCEKENDVTKVKNVIFPDIPLRRDVNKTKDDVFCFFISDLHMDKEDFMKKSYDKFLDWVEKVDYKKFYIFVLGDVSSKKDDIKDFFSRLPPNSFKIFLKGHAEPDLQVGDMYIEEPSLLKIEKMVAILACHGGFFHTYQTIWENITPENLLLNLLKKRHINPIFDNKIYEKDPFLLDVIPDIFVSGHFHHPSFFNYKGTTIITNGSFVTTPIFWLTNLRTRDVIKLDFT